MISFISKIGSISLALMVLVSTISFTVDAHYCGNILVDKAILSKAKTCEMHQQMPSEDEDSCCDNEVETIEGQDILQFSKAEFDLDIPLEFTVFSLIYFCDLDIFEKQIDKFQFYTPPQHSLDLQLLKQVFLI
ncbi:HYC_CC_PP family protein [Psychroflexus sp. MES1-P1E]|uniref:HYC_CC_PP family protein n=1 Tax=Psychroflexus sp. MES1-P1E TaxID=2058320 RepID=UPI000C7D2B6F|nr:hypothetical protein [Psychroflexus sp. MES1-P1E]PKG42029.1 hypothetical protein CXF67_12405 [Psychroflexus sp. MES1-P1E]